MSVKVQFNPSTLKASYDAATSKAQVVDTSSWACTCYPNLPNDYTVNFKYCDACPYLDERFQKENCNWENDSAFYNKDLWYPSENQFKIFMEHTASQWEITVEVDRNAGESLIAFCNRTREGSKDVVGIYTDGSPYDVTVTWTMGWNP